MHRAIDGEIREALQEVRRRIAAIKIPDVSVPELVEKAKHLPKDINWHLIGHLQTNKVKTLLSVPNLKVIQSVDSAKLASIIDKECQKLNRKIEIFLQMNLSQESSKYGIIDDSQCHEVIEHINQSCPNLTLQGLMSIGPGDCPSNIDFLNMKRLYDEVKKKYNFDKFQLSIGMSSDFEEAIKHGATIVRVGTSIFGQRSAKNVESSIQHTSSA